MWVPKRYLELRAKQVDELERRVKRLELICLNDAEYKIASLRNKEAGNIQTDGVLTVEEILNKINDGG